MHLTKYVFEKSLIASVSVEFVNKTGTSFLTIVH